MTRTHAIAEAKSINTNIRSLDKSDVNQTSSISMGIDAGSNEDTQT